MRQIILSILASAAMPLLAQGIAEVGATIELVPSTYYSGVAWTADTYICNNHNASIWGTITKVQGEPPGDTNGNAWYKPEYILTDKYSVWTTTTAPYCDSEYYNGLPATVWCLNSETADIYIRREFVLTEPLEGTIYLATGHDDGPSQFYINGTEVYSTSSDWLESDYVRLADKYVSLIKTDGTPNVLAVHVHNNYGGSYADCGLYSTDAALALRGSLSLGYDSPWTARLLYNAEGGYNGQGNNTESTIHGWEHLYEAQASDVYTITLPTAAQQNEYGRVQFKTPITIAATHSYRLQLTLDATEAVSATVRLSENDDDATTLFATTLSLAAATPYTLTESGITGVAIEDMTLELLLPTTVDNTIVTLSGVTLYDETAAEELFIGTSYFNYRYYADPLTGTRLADMPLEGRCETLTWTTATFDDTMWQTAVMPIGSDGFISEVQTLWQGGENNNYWLRRSFTLTEVNTTTRYTLLLCHDDAYTVYVNGYEIASGTDWTVGKNYEKFVIPASYLTVGENVIAIYIQQNWGGSFYDCGMQIDEDFYEEYDADSDPTVIEINEVQVSNIDQYIDYSYNYGGWIELYNPSDKRILLDGLYVSDDAAEAKKFMLPDGFGVIGAKGYKVIYFGNNGDDGNYGDTAYKQVNFKLNTEGGTILLADEKGELIDEVDYPSAVARCSYARRDDSGDVWGMTATATPGASNSGSTFATERLSAPEIDCDSQLFTDPFAVTVTIPAGATLRYTTDGSTPTLSNGNTSSTGRFDISTTQTLRFCLFADDMLPSMVVTRSYIYRDKDYYLPVVSIVTAPANLYDDTIGVYVDGNNGIEGNNHTKSNLNMDWKRPVNFEYITADNVMGVSMETEFEVSGGWSRHYAPASFKLKASKSYEGLTSIDYPFFHLKPYNKYKQLLIRNGGNDNDSSSHGRVRDAITQQALMTTGVYVDAQDYQPVHLFINGEYTGMLNLREPNNRYHGTANYGYDDDEMDAFEYSNGYFQKAGTRDAFDRWVTLAAQATDDSAYETLRQEVVDMDEFINYWAAECYIGSSDWIMNSNNVKGYRTLPDGRFRLTMFDVDWGWSTRRGLTNVNDNYGNDMLAIYNNLKKNASFARQFVDAYCLMAGSVFTSAHCEAVADSICTLVEPALALEGREPWTSYNEQYTNMIDVSRDEVRFELLREYYNLSDGMTVAFRANVPSAAFRLNGQYVPTGQFDGILFAPVEIEVSAGAAYNFVGWQDANGTGAQIISSDRLLTLTKDEDLSLVAVFEPVSDSDRVAAGAPPVVINEISAGNSIFVNEFFKRNDWIELYNTTDAAVDVEGMYLTDNLSNPYKYQLSAEGTGATTVIAPHGYLIVWADKLTPVEQLHATFNLGNSDGEAVMLTAKDFSWSDTLTYVAHLGEESVGRYPDGGKRIYKMSKPSIAAANWVNTYAAWVDGDDVNYVAPTTPTPDPDAISRTRGDATIVRTEYYSVDGRQLPAPQSGVNIVRQTAADGTTTTRRIVVK